MNTAMGTGGKRAVGRENVFSIMDEALTMLDGALAALDEQRREAGFGEKIIRRHRRDFAGDESAIMELRGLSPKAKEFLNHHVRNTLAGVITYCVQEKYEETQSVAMQLVDVLEMIAPLPCGKKEHGI